MFLISLISAANYPFLICLFQFMFIHICLVIFHLLNKFSNEHNDPMTATTNRTTLLIVKYRLLVSPCKCELHESRIPNLGTQECYKTFLIEKKNVKRDPTVGFIDIWFTIRKTMTNPIPSYDYNNFILPVQINTITKTLGIKLYQQSAFLQDFSANKNLSRGLLANKIDGILQIMWGMRAAPLIFFPMFWHDYLVFSVWLAVFWEIGIATL